MNPAEIVQAAKADGVQLSLSPTGAIKAAGEQTAVLRWRSILAEHKAEIIHHLTEEAGLAPTAPAWCRGDCPALEILPGVGPGCVRALEDGPWREEWRRLDTMATCPERMH